METSLDDSLDYYNLLGLILPLKYSYCKNFTNFFLSKFGPGPSKNTVKVMRHSRIHFTKIDMSNLCILLMGYLWNSNVCFTY